MLKNNGKRIIGRNFIFCLVVICLMFTVFGLSVENSFAIELNETHDGFDLESDNFEKLGNSQDNEILEVNSHEGEEILGDTIKPQGDIYRSIQEAVTSAHDDDIIKLNGTYHSNGNDKILINKRLTITADTTATLDGRHLSIAFVVNEGGAGTVFKNLKFINGEGDIGSAVAVHAKNIRFEDCIFEDNHANSGGAIHTRYDLNVASGLIVEHCQFRRNTGYYKDLNNETSGSALAIYGKDSEVRNCIFEDNWVKSKLSSYGGAIQIGLDEPGSNNKVIGCTFKNNHAYSIDEYSHGGAGCVRTGTSYINCIFENNSADWGGALTFHSSGEIKNCTFVGNVARQYGGALSTGFMPGPMELNVVKCNFYDNAAPMGGAIQALGSNVIIDDSIFKNNHVTETGGAIHVKAEDVTVKNSFFNSNVANINGGAIYIEGNNTIVKQSTFLSNEAIPDVNKVNDGLGGAIYVDSSQAYIGDNIFRFNTARNGSAIYYAESGERLTLENNELFQNQAWVYGLPISAEDIYYGDQEEIRVTLFGGNNIADFDNLAVSNALYNAADNLNIVINGQYPLIGARNDGDLYQDSREYNINVLLTVRHEDGTIVYNEVGHTNYLGEIVVDFDNLKPGKYYVSAKHYEDTYYKAINNATTFVVKPKVDNEVTKSVSNANPNFEDVITWTITIKNNGPNDSTNVTVCDVLPNGLTYYEDNSKGKYNHDTGVLTVGNLAVNEIYSFNIIAIVEKTGTIVNKVNVTSSEFDVDTTNNVAEKSIFVNPSSDLAVVKSASNSKPNYKDHIIWTIEVSNNGPDTAHNVSVYDLFPKSLIYVDSDGNYDESAGIWNIGTLESGKKIKINIECIINATGSIVNSAFVNASEFDYDMTNNKDTRSIYVSASSDLDIKKAVNSTNVNYGDFVKWTLTVSNNGPDDATNVKIVDILPVGFEYVNSSLEFDDGSFTVDELKVGEEITVEIITLVETTGEFSNYANVTCDEYDFDLTNNEAQKGIFVNPACDLSVIKSVSESNPRYRDIITWTIEVVNNGPDVAHNVTVKDLLTDSLIWISDDSQGKYNPKTGILVLERLDVDESFVINIECMVNATGDIDNHAFVNATEFDYDLTNNNYTESIFVDPASDLVIKKAVNASNVNYGDFVKWTLTVSNNGPDDASNVKIEDILPKGFKYISSSLEFDDGSFTVDELKVGYEMAIEIITLVETTGEFSNYANVTCDEYDFDLTNNEAQKGIFVNPACDLSVIKSVSESNPRYRDIITWTIEVVNNGPDVAHNVTINDLLTDSLIWVSDDSQGKYDSLKGILAVDKLDVGSSFVLNMKCRVNSTGFINNNVSAIANEYDYNLTNNFANKTINVNKSADVSVIKSVNISQPNYLDLVEWTLVISNAGPDKATNVFVEDALPKGLVFINYTATKGFYDNGIWTMCCLNNGDSETLEIICRVNRTGCITNIARIHADEYDFNEGNNEANESIEVPPAVDIEVLIEVNISNPLFGSPVNWTITVKNNGPDNATNVKLQDILPEELIYCESDSNNGIYDESIWDIGFLGVGDEVTLNIVTISNALGVIVNEVNATSKEYDWNMVNNYADACIDVDPVVDLSITKLVDNDSPKYGETVKWTLVAYNDGPNVANNVIVQDVLPEGLAFVKSNGKYHDDIWEVGILDVGETKKLEIICKVTSTGSFTNLAKISSDEFDLKESNNQALKSISVGPASDLAITKIASKYHYKFGEVIEYDIEVVNNGPDTAYNIKVDEILDDLLKLKSFKLSKGKFNKFTYVWTIDKLGYGESAKLVIEAIAIGSGIVKNTVNVSCDNYDWDMSNNKDFAIVEVAKKPLDKNLTSFNPEKRNLNDELPSNLEFHPTANPLAILAWSCVFSIIFLGEVISKKR